MRISTQKEQFCWGI